MIAAERPTSSTPEPPGLGDRLEALAPWFFLAYALPAVFFLSIAMGPFQVPDERAHAMRADQISLGGLVPERIEGWVHRTLVDYARPYEAMWFHPEVKQEVELARRMGEIRWSSDLERVNFQNTVQYGPVLYLPMVASFWLARAVDATVAQTLVLARIVNGLAACLAAFVALRICRRGRALMFVTLLLPMTLSQFASASQDALMIALSLLVIAMASRTLAERREAGLGESAIFAAVVAATTIARPSQIALALLTPIFFARQDAHRCAKLLVGACAVGVIAGWMILLRWLMPPPASEWDPYGQFIHVLTHPLALPMAILNTFADRGWWLLETLTGRIGWLDTPMPGGFTVVASVALASALVTSAKDEGSLRGMGLAALTLLVFISATFGALYITWNPVGHPIVDGVQGRYALPVLPLLAWLTPQVASRPARVLAHAWIPLLAVPLVGLVILPVVLMLRYYGSWPVMDESLRALLMPG